MQKVTPEKFYRAFLDAIEKNGFVNTWYSNGKWTKGLLKDRDCVMKRVADKLGLIYCNEYFTLDGVFYRKTIKYGDLEYGQNIEIILECENDWRTITKEIWKIFPLFFAPLKVVITYPRDKQKAEEIKNIIKDRIKNDDPFGLHKNKIKTLLIFGHMENKKIIWQGFIYKNKTFIKL